MIAGAGLKHGSASVASSVFSVVRPAGFGTAPFACMLLLFEVGVDARID